MCIGENKDMAKILVIDDIEAIRQSIVYILKSDGHEIEEAENGLVGLDMIKNGTYDMVITDILMPEKDGTEMMIELRDEGINVPVLAISGGGRLVSGDYALKLAENYANDVLRKPFTKDELREKVNLLLVQELGASV